MFDLPVVTVEERQIYSKFRKFLLKDGYIMVQFSIYSRICKNNDDVTKHINRIRQNLPDKGNIRLLQVTEKQYQDMIYLRGEKNNFDILVGGKELVIFGGDYCDNYENAN